MPARTPDHVRRLFAVEYLKTASTALSAKAAGIPYSTAQNIAADLELDEDFVATRKAARAQLFAKATDVALAALEKCAERLASLEPLIDARGAYSDLGATYARAAADLGRTVERLTRFEAEKSGEVPSGPAVVIHLAGDVADAPPSSAPR